MKNKKHFNIYDHLGTLQQTYINTGFNLTPTSMQTQKPFGGDNWSNSTLTTKESTLLNWIGKEKDHESKLGDHGVRKYEYETGRFISVDPLWGKYYGWTPYQYSMNSPVMSIDRGGEDVIVLYAGIQTRAKGGHIAILVGQGDGPYTLISKDGAKSWHGLFGDAKSTMQEFDNLKEFYKSDFYKYLDYSGAFRIKSTADEDNKAIFYAARKADEYYDVLTNNCGHSSMAGIYFGLDNPIKTSYSVIPYFLFNKVVDDYKDRGKKVILQKGEKDQNEFPGREKYKHKEFDTKGKEK